MFKMIKLAVWKEWENFKFHKVKYIIVMTVMVGVVFTDTIFRLTFFNFFLIFMCFTLIDILAKAFDMWWSDKKK